MLNGARVQRGLALTTPAEAAVCRSYVVASDKRGHTCVRTHSYSLPERSQSAAVSAFWSGASAVGSGSVQHAHTVYVAFTGVLWSVGLAADNLH